MQLLNKLLILLDKDKAGFTSVYDRTCMFSFETPMTDTRIIARYGNYVALYGNSSVLK